MLAATTDVQAMVNLRAHCGSTAYELDERTMNRLYDDTRREGRTCIVGGRWVSEP